MTYTAILAAGGAVFLIAGSALAFERPAAPSKIQPHLPLVKASTLCDARGCFIFGPVQSFRPAYVQPNYRPPEATGPTYYRPTERGPAPLYNNPPPLPRPIKPEISGNRGSHEQWCRNQYRTYDARTDRFVTYQGIYKTCNSPYD